MVPIPKKIRPIPMSKFRFITSLLNPAGGLLYHVKAGLYKDTLWTPFRSMIATWMTPWISCVQKTHQNLSRTLLLIGPSGGYCLPLKAISQVYHEIIYVDPDPLARLIFESRFKSASEQNRIIRWEIISADFKSFQSLLSRYPKGDILFCNFLGQLRFLCNEQQLNDWRNGLRLALKSRHWASFHDRVSGDIPPKPELRNKPIIVSPSLTNSDIIERMFEQSYCEERSTQGSLNASHELLDHLTADLFDGSLPRFYSWWHLAPHQFHLVEGVHSSIEEG